MGEDGRGLVLLDPGDSGAPEPSAIAERLDDGDVGFVSIMQGNNELGTLSDIATIASYCRQRGVIFHTDAVQTAGYGLLRVDEADVDLASLSAHKMYGPKGVGALFVRGGVDLEPLLEGGAQERRRRGGTENVAAIVGMARALTLSIESAPERRERAAAMRDRLHRGLVELIGPRMIVNTPINEVPLMPHVLNVAFPPLDGEPLDGEMLLLNLDVEGVLASAGSACTSGALEPSHVLTAIGLDPATASTGVRLSVGKDTTEDDIDYVVDVVDRVIRRMTREKVGA
jgi:cysteine desulfurase